MKMIIVRHGLTVENKLGICQGQTEGRLSREGIVENEHLSFELKDTPVDAFYSSTLSRARQTLSQIIKFHREKPFFLDPRLMEWGMGPWEGKPCPENDNFYENLDSVESFEKVKNRCTSFLNHIKEKHPKQTVLVVSHGLTIRMMESILLKVDFNEVILPKNSTIKTFIL